MKLNNEIKDEINTLVNSAIEKFDIKKIYLFGSYVNGEPNDDSDVDICIISNDNKRKLVIIRELRKSIVGKINHTLDILIYRQEEFEQRAKTINSIELIKKLRRINRKKNKVIQPKNVYNRKDKSWKKLIGEKNE